MSTQHAIIVEDLSKTFIVHHNRVTSLKGRFIGLFKQRWQQHTESFPALTHVSFSIQRGEAIGIMGPNGSGKSTLLQLIAGIYKPTSGVIRVNGRVAPLIQLGVGFHIELTGEENIYLGASLYGFTNRDIRSKYQQIVDFSELGTFIDTPIKNYSSGMLMRLGFSIAAHLEPDILLADEILAVGDENFRKKCLERIRELRKKGMTLVLVSHMQEQVDTFCDSYLKLAKGRVIEQGRTQPPVVAPAK
ncbi:MAG: ABC transporter ATP-binding protein [Gammaproteobacteria bacterium]